MTMRAPLLALALAAALGACGGSKPPAQSATSDTSDGGASAADAAADDIKPFAGVDVEPPDASAPAPPPDECTPIAVDFEKRARPKLKECYRDGKKKDPNLEGTVKIAVDVNTLGKITSIKITEKTLPNPVAQCMLKVVKATPFPESAKCPGKALTIPVTFPTPR